MTAKKFSVVESIQICLLLCLLAVGTNLFLPIYIIGQTHLLIGSTFAFLAILILPLTYVLVVVICVFVSLVTGDHLWTIPLFFLLEICVIYFLKQRNIFILMASMLYWIFIGVPVLLVVSHFNANDIQGANVIVTLHTALNGLLNAAMAATIYSFIPHKWLLSHVSTQHKLSSNIFAISASTLVVPILIVSFAFIAQQSQQKEVAKKEQLKNSSLLIGQVTSSFIGKHLLIVEQIAIAVSESLTLQGPKKIMLAAQKNDPTFFNIILSAKNGDILYFAPERYNDLAARLPLSVRTVRDRNYFTDAKTSLKTVVSNVMLSRGIVVAPMIAVASPIIKDGEFDGTVLGAINLLSLKKFYLDLKKIAGNKMVVITDSQSKVVFSTHPEHFEALSIFSFQKDQSALIRDLPVLTLLKNKYVYEKTSTQYGWQVYLLEDASEFVFSIRQQLIWVSCGLIFVFSIFLYFAYKLSNRITAPLISLLQNGDDYTSDAFDNKYASQEISAMANKLKRSSYLMKNFEHRLKLQVEEKTEKLEQLNLQLAAQAREDGLTSLLNRGGFNELAVNAIKTSYRLNQPFSVALLDIDKFKDVNDTYGHLIGDKCLVEFAKLMQDFCKRETDIIGRYGGEEFVIFMSGTDIQSHHNLINDIHRQTRFIQVVDEDSKNKISFTVSIGICSVLSSVNLDLKGLINVADDELYKCKRTGRDRVSITTVG